MEEVKTNQRFSLFFPELRCSPLEFISRKTRQYLTETEKERLSLKQREFTFYVTFSQPLPWPWPWSWSLKLHIKSNDNYRKTLS